ncbi:MAG: glycosyltransferase family 2 protein [Thermodesulfobacteriota bacterium]
MHQGTDIKSQIELSTAKTHLSVVVPAYNEDGVLPEFHKRISAVLESMAVDAEIVYVNDGSIDHTLAVMQFIRESDPRVAIVDLSRNFGKDIAITAGLDHANGDAVVVIDADLQHPPELIPELVKHWNEGYDVVYVKRISRMGESLIKRITTYAFYRLIQTVSRVKIPEDASDYRLLSRRALDSLKLLREQHRFMKGLFTWIGYPQKAISYQPDPRYAGQTKWSYWNLWNFALEGITSFSTVPLKFATYLGLLTALPAFIYAVVIIYQTIVYGNPVPGYPSLMIVILFLGGVQLITIGIIGEYLGRMFDETKQRPLYFLKGYEPSASRKALL